MNPKAFWSLLVLFGALILSVGAKAEPTPQGRGHPCMTPVSQDVMGTVVILRKNCDLAVVINAFPQIDSATGKPYPSQVQRRSIYAANQAREEDGVSYPRSVLRTCARPGRPDAHADADELASCPDGLMHYFAVAGAKIFIPVDREYTAAEKQAMKQAKEAAAEAGREKQDQEKTSNLAALERAGKEFEERVHKLETALSQLQARVNALEPQAAKGFWFLPLLILSLLGLVWGAGATYAAVSLRKRAGTTRVLGYRYPSPQAALDDLRSRYSGLKAEKDQWCSRQDAAAEEHAAEKARLEAKNTELENLRAIDHALAEMLQRDVYQQLEEVGQLRSLNESLRRDVAKLEARCGELKEEKSALQEARSGQVKQMQSLLRDMENKDRRIGELEAAQNAASPEERFVAIVEEKDRIRTERDESRRHLGQFIDLAYGQKFPEGFEFLPEPERAKQALETLTRSLCLAYATSSTVNSTVPPPTTSDFVIASAGSGRSRLEPDLALFQSQLAQAPSHFVVDFVKILMREWAIRIGCEGELAYRINSTVELNELNAFVRSPILIAPDPSLTALVGDADVSRIHLAADWSYADPVNDVRRSAMPRASG